MGGAFYVLTEILLFLVLAAVIGFVIGRLTVGRGEPSGPLKRLSEVETSSTRAADAPDQAGDLRRRLGIAYQTIRELEESNMHLREAAESAGSTANESAPPDDESDAVAASAEAVIEEAPAAEKADHVDRPVASQSKTAQGGPAELIRVAKAAKQSETAPHRETAESLEAVPEADV